MLDIGGGWEPVACRDALPNTHWHLLRLSSPGDSWDGVWAGWRVHKAGQPDYAGVWHDWSPEERSDHLVWSAATSPLGVTLGDLFEEIARHGHGLDGHPNTYPYGEVDALATAIGLNDPDMEAAAFLLGLGATTHHPAADALAETRGGLFPPHRSNRFHPRDQLTLSFADAN